MWKSVLSTSLGALLLAASGSPAREWNLDEIVAALRAVETGGTPHDGRDAVGDSGAAIGPLQIHRAYWKDAGVPGVFEDCRELGYAKDVAVAYWTRYCPEALRSLDAETLARVHNGGPNGPKRECTRPFWLKVERELARRNSSTGYKPAPHSLPSRPSGNVPARPVRRA